jgi:hypothetical protein
LREKCGLHPLRVTKWQVTIVCFWPQKSIKSGRTLVDIISMDVSSIALQGLQQADFQLEAAATQIASTGVNSPDGATLDVVELSSEMVALMTARTLFDINLATLKAAEQMQRSLIDLKA